MAAASLIVCERSGRWGLPIRRSVGDAIEVRQAGGRIDLRQELLARPHSLAAIEAAGVALAMLLDWIGELAWEFPLAASVVLVDRRLAPHSHLLLEAGAIWCFDSPRRLAPLAAILGRPQFHASGRPSLVEQIWNNLPLSTA